MSHFKRHLFYILVYPHLLHVSVCGLPHVVVLYDTGQRLPRQLHRRKEWICVEEGGETERKLTILISHVLAIRVRKPSCIFMKERHRDHRGWKLPALLGFKPWMNHTYTDKHHDSHINKYSWAPGAIVYTLQTQYKVGSKVQQNQMVSPCKLQRRLLKWVISSYTEQQLQSVWNPVSYNGLPSLHVYTDPKEESKCPQVLLKSNQQHNRSQSVCWVSFTKCTIYYLISLNDAEKNSVFKTILFVWWK